MTKRIFSVVLLIIFSIGMGGCMNMKKNYTPEEKKEKVLEYLMQKYNEEFIPTNMSQAAWGQPKDEMFLYPKKGTKEDSFCVHATTKDDGSYSIKDGYFGIIIRDKYETVMKSFVRDVFKDAKVITRFSDNAVFSDSLNKDTVIDEIYSKDEYFSSQTIIFIKKSIAEGINTKKSINEIAQKMVKNKLVGDILLYIVYDDKFDNMGIDALDMNPTKEIEYFESKVNRSRAYYYTYITHELKIEIGGD